MPTAEDYRSAARAWLEDDPDPETRAELTALLATSGHSSDRELSERFGTALSFGTAGLRGLLGAGPNRMNRRVVLKTTVGFCRYLLDRVPNAALRGVCIGYDARRKSREFAEDAAAAVTGAGLIAHVFDELVPTPLVAFAVTQQRAAGGIMITASHNPPDYNGYKVYWGNGAQIIPPHDEGIRATIEDVGRVSELSLPRREELPEQYRTLGPDVIDRYFTELSSLQVHPELPRRISVAYTALHGVGERFVRRALSDAGFDTVDSVEAQADPDGSFPTVSFPNPEEDGAMDAVLALAEDNQADLVLANDPDADRLAVAVRTAVGYRKLSGNEIGCVLAHYLLSEDGTRSGHDERQPRLVINTIVSSPMLRVIAEAHGAQSEQTLTGFKWIANRAIERGAAGDRFVMGYEEALGYTVGTVVRDKDGVGAALVMADLAAWCHGQGRSVADELERMARRYGVFPSRQESVVLEGVEGAERIRSAMARLRSSPPDRLGAFRVRALSDYAQGVRRSTAGETPLALPPADVLLFEVMRGGDAPAARVMVRPSGTEPKLKFYFDAQVLLGEDESLEAAERRGALELEALATQIFRHVGLD